MIKRYTKGAISLNGLVCQSEKNKCYEIFIDDFSFGDIPKEILISIFKDGRPSSYFIEALVEHHFEDLKQVLGCKGHDFIDIKGQKYDAKNFTKNGLRFMPSNMIGAKRSFDSNIYESKMEKDDLIYVLCDIVEFPKIRLKFIHWEELYKKYPNGVIKFKDRDQIFEGG